MSLSYSREIQAIRNTFETGKTFKAEWRVSQLKQLQKLIEENVPLIEEALRKDLGWSKEQTSISEIDMMAPEIKYMLDNLHSLMKPESAFTPAVMKPAKSYIVKEPLGVILVISPWNYPIHLALNPVIDAIAAGNCVVIKPSEVSQNCSHLIAELIPKYMDKTAVMVIEGGVPETTAILKEKFDHIVYTGNSKVARIVMVAAAQHLTPVTLELGGKNAVVVDKDADLDTAAQRIAWGKWMNCGQTCLAPDYVIAHRDIEQALISKIQSSLKRFYGSDPKKSNDYSRIINEQHTRRLLGLLDDKGKIEIACGGEAEEKDRYLAPTVVRNVSEDSKIMQDEIFGPILPILDTSLFPSDSFIDSAIKFIKTKPRALALYVFASNDSAKKRITREIPFGGGCVNDVIIHAVTPHLPFGGVGESGMGSYHGKAGFNRFSHHKSILSNGTLLDPSIRYPPYTPQKAYLLRVLKSVDLGKVLSPVVVVGLAVAFYFFREQAFNWAAKFS